MPRPAKATLSDVEWEACEAEWRVNVGASELARKYGVPRQTIQSRFAATPINAGRKAAIVRSIAEGKPPPALSKKLKDEVAVQAIADSVVMSQSARGQATIIRRISEAAETASASVLPSLAQGLQRATEGFRSARELDTDADQPRKARVEFVDP